jgi:hypothetical protein
MGPNTRPRCTWNGCAHGGLGKKRSLALREFALGIEAPIWVSVLENRRFTLRSAIAN